MIFPRHLSAETLSRMLDGMLDLQAQAQARKHLDHCAGCGRLFQGQAKVKAALKKLPSLEWNPLQELQPPVFIPVVRPAFPLWGFAAGIAVGIIGVAAVTRFQPMHPPMRVISSSAQMRTEELKPGETVNALAAGNVDLEIPNQLLLRLRPGTTMTWEELGRPWPFGGRPQIVLNVMRGEVLARTQDKFWGSRLQVRTPSANATVKGTAFSVKVEPQQDATVLKVLAGSVFFSPYLGEVGLNVRSGQTSQIHGRQLTHPAQNLSPAERKTLLETYRIGEDPVTALVIGGGPERVEELLRPALLYLGAQPHPELHLFIRSLAAKINAAILKGELSTQEKNIRALESILPTIQDPQIVVPLRLFVGACEVRLGHVLRGRYHFRWVKDRHPQHPLASVAWAALGLTAESDLRNPELAQAAWQPLLAQYPGTPEAIPPREFLRHYAAR